MKRAAKIIGWIFTGLALLVLLLLTLSQTGWFRSWVKDKVIQVANEQLEGELQIDQLKGNFFTHLDLRHLVVLLEDGDTLLAVDRLQVRYDPLALLNKEIFVEHIRLNRPRVWLEQFNDSTWNFESLLPPSDTPTPDEPEDGSPFGLKVWLPELTLQEGSISIDSPDSLLPAYVGDLQLLLAASYSAKKAEVSLKEFGFYTRQPDFRLHNLSILAQTDFVRHRLEKLDVKTENNHITAEGHWMDLENFRLKLNWPKVLLDEFAFIVPETGLMAQPQLQLLGDANDGDLQLDFSVDYAGESIRLQGRVPAFQNWLSDSLRHLGNMDLHLSTVALEPQHWLAIDTLPLVLNTSFQIQGNGLSAEARPLKVEGRFLDSRFEGHRLEAGQMVVELQHPLVSTQVELGGTFGQLEAVGQVDLRDEGPFALEAQLRRLALHQLLPQQVDSTLLNFNIKAAGKGALSDHPEATFSGILQASVLESIPIDTFEFRGFYRDQDLQLDTLFVKNISLKAGLRARYFNNGTLEAALAGELFNTKAFTAYTDEAVEWEQLDFDASARGSVDSLLFQFNTQLAALEFDTLLNLKQMDLWAGGQLVKGAPTLETQLRASGLSSGDYLVDTLSLDAALHDALWKAQVDLRPRDLPEVHLAARGNTSDSLWVVLEQLDLNAEVAQLYLLNDSAKLHYHEGRASLSHFRMGDRLDSLFMLEADARAELPDSLGLDLHLSNLNLALLSKLKLSPQEIKGRAHLQLNAAGNPKSFQLNAGTQLEQLKMDPLTIAQLSADISYAGDTLHFQSSLLSQLGDALVLEGSSPLDIQLSDSLLVHWPGTLLARLHTHTSRLEGFLAEQEGLPSPQALMSMDFQIMGQAQDPQVKGYIDLSEGTLPLPRWGIDYTGLRLKASVEETRISLDSLFARHGNGTLLAQGYVDMDSSLTSGRLSDTNLRLTAREFHLSRHRNHEIQINADAFFRDQDQQPRFGGNIEVLRSNFYLPALLDMAGDGSELNDPLLVQALKNQQTEALHTEEAALADSSRQQSIEQRPTYNLVEQLTGRMRVDIPRNTWVRSPDMQMELYGHLDVVKNSDIFELFGSLGIHRGFYALYGKKLVIRQGELTFTGGEAFNPAVNLKADYTFRDPERRKRLLTLLVGGTAMEPDISFDLDGQPVPEADAMAYLLFGQSFDQLSYGNQEGVSNALPSRLINSVLSAQLSKTLGSTLNLDMIEIDAGDDWQNTSFMVGKYLTNDLFVTYQRSFGQTDDESVSPQTITLEYEISRIFSLRLLQGQAKESGVDLIIKFETGRKSTD